MTKIIIILSSVGGATIFGSVALIWRNRKIQKNLRTREFETLNRDFQRRDHELTNNYLESRGWIHRDNETWDIEAMMARDGAIEYGPTPPEQAHIPRNSQDTFINSCLENENIINQDLILWLITFTIMVLFIVILLKKTKHI